jgi:protein-L-isoaspartate(D-aspartate) O-methyltransferase
MIDDIAMLRIASMLFLTVISMAPLMVCAAPKDDYDTQRRQMVANQIKARGVKDSRVLAALLKVERHLFIPPENRHLAYQDFPVPIGEGQTISQPYIVAFMSEALGLKGTERVLEIGTGSGYQAAILGELAAEVCSIEIIPSLGERAAVLLDDLGYDNIMVRIGDGYRGWPEHAPFDAIIVTCAPERVPPALVEQLKEGGAIVIPVGPVDGVQKLIKGIKKGGKLDIRDELPVRFVPMVRGNR